MPSIGGYAMTSAEVLQGDCLQILPTLPDNSVDLVLTDPPYFKVKGDAWDNQWDEPTAFLSWLGEVVAELARVLRPNGSLYLFASPQMGSRVETLIGARLNVVCNIRWRKPRFSTKAEMFRKGDLRSYFPASETIVFAEHRAPWSVPLRTAREAAGISRADLSERVVGSRSGAVWNWEAGIRFPEEHHWHALKTVLPTLPEYGDVARPFRVSDEVPYTDVWDFPTVQAYPGKHPCEKPQALLRHIIEASSKPGAVVLDAFAGTGSTGIAARALDRSFIGIELSEQYATTARQRIAEVGAPTPQAELFAA